jgi:pyrroline-5-carboxylate reductase
MYHNGNLTVRKGYAMLQGKKIGIIGAGHMGEAILRGLVGEDVSDVLVCDVKSERRDHIETTYNVQTVGDSSAVVETCDIIVLAVKPQDAKPVLEGVCPFVDRSKLLISIVAGISVGAICSFLGANMRLIRAMPNIAAMVQESATALVRGADATEEDLETARAIFDALGSTVVVSEELMDAVTGLSGSGPAYVSMFIEALADGGVKLGLTRKDALTLAVQTVLGTAKLLLKTGLHPGMLKDRVASPGGTTISGIGALEDRGFRGTVIDAVVAAAERAEELSSL